MLRLTEGYQYKILGNLKVTYVGVNKGINYNCDMCRKERWNTHNFVYGDVNNPSTQYFYGTECIKKLDIKEV